MVRAGYDCMYMCVCRKFFLGRGKRFTGENFQIYGTKTNKDAENRKKIAKSFNELIYPIVSILTVSYSYSWLQTKPISSFSKYAPNPGPSPDAYIYIYKVHA